MLITAWNRSPCLPSGRRELVTPATIRCRESKIHHSPPDSYSLMFLRLDNSLISSCVMLTHTQQKLSVVSRNEESTHRKSSWPDESLTLHLRRFSCNKRCFQRLFGHQTSTVVVYMTLHELPCLYDEVVILDGVVYEGSRFLRLSLEYQKLPRHVFPVQLRSK